MSRRVKRVLKILAVAYLVTLLLFLLSISKGRHEYTRPTLEPTYLEIPQRAAFASDKEFEAYKGDIIGARYLTRGPNAGVKGNTRIDAEVLARLIEADPGRITVWGARHIRELAAKKLIAGEKFLAPNGTLIVDVGHELTEEALQKMALAYDGQERDEDRHDRMLVKGAGSLIGFDLTLVFTGLNFLVLVAALYAFLWGPVTRLLDDRARSVREDVDTARRSREEAQSLRETREAELGKIHEDADRLREEGRHKGEAERARLIQEGREEASRLAERRERALAAEAEQARKDLAGQIGTMSVELASKILGREVSAEDHKSLAEKFVRKLESEAGSKEAQG